jgi:glycosyltransferase involved in cell wall biosynthesis
MVIANSWHSFFYPADFSIHHGTTRGIMLRIPELKTYANKIISFMEKSSCGVSRNILAVSSRTRQELTELYHVNAKKISVLNNFVNENIFFPLEDKKRTAASGVIILFSGRLEKRKGVEALKILSDAIENKKDYTLIIACNTPLNADLFAGNRNTSVLVGLRLQEMRSFYNSGDILFFPSLYEGFSMATLEALSCGIPVIGTEYAIQEELRGYDFARVYDHFEIDKILEQIKTLVQKYRLKRHEIHGAIKRDFGYKQYEEKLLSLIKGNKK